MQQDAAVRAPANWRDFERALEISGKGRFPSDAEALDRDQGRYLGFVRVVGERNEAAAANYYYPGILGGPGSVR